MLIIVYNIVYHNVYRMVLCIVLLIINMDIPVLPCINKNII
jgi:hypothetical protein